MTSLQLFIDLTDRLDLRECSGAPRPILIDAYLVENERDLARSPLFIDLIDHAHLFHR